MNSKIRVQKALKREPIDRIPVYIWLHPATKEKLSGMLEIPETLVDLAMGNDVQQTWVNNNYVFEGIALKQDGEKYRDPWGINWERQGYYNQISSNPLETATTEEIREYAFPFDCIESLLDRMAAIALLKGEFFIGCDVSPCAFAMYDRLRGMEKALLDIALQPVFTGEMLKKCIQFASSLATEAIHRYTLDWLWTGDDVASNKNMLFHPDYWRETIKPELKVLFEIGKANHLWVAYHCCGAMREIIPDLIEIGMDVLNPVQCTCPGMDPLELKKDFGSQIAFMGGLDTENLLPDGSVKEIQQTTVNLIEGMTADGGGFILAGTHTIPPETALENIFAVYDIAGIQKQEILDNAASIRNLLKEVHEMH